FITADRRVEKTSGYRGVTFVHARAHLATPWRAQVLNIYTDKKEHLGYFAAEEAAAHAYDARAVALYGAQAYPNFPHELCCIVTRADRCAGAPASYDEIPF